MERSEYTTKILLTILGACFLVFVVLSLSLVREKRDRKIIIDWNSPEFIGERSGKYYAIFAKYNPDEELPDKVLEEFEEETFAKVLDNEQLIDLYGISFKEGTLSQLAIDCNTALFDMCNKFYLTSWNGRQLSPVIPMAIANIETGGRADQSVTYSSLFPSACVSVKSADAIVNMSCVAVLENAVTFNKLASDHWTRDRGPMQMNPDYGVGLESYNSLMGPSEASILSNVGGTDIDFSGYQAWEPRNSRNIGVEEWLDGLATTPGDRHNVKDVILRFASASQEAIDSYCSLYDIRNNLEAVAVIAMHHNSGSVWNPGMLTKKVGNWRSGQSAYAYCSAISSTEFTNKIKALVEENITKARSSGKRLTMTLDRSEAKALYAEAVSDGIIKDYTTYVVEGQYYEVTYCYPIQAMYAYLMLTAVYSGK